MKPKPKNRNTTQRLSEGNPGISESAAISLGPVVPGISPLLSTEEVARALHVGAGTLEVWRATRRVNLPFVKIGRKIYYRLETVQAFLIEREGLETTAIDQSWRRQRGGQR